MGVAVPELLVVRHAKSDWSSGADHDRDRPLSGRGRRAAQAMGAALRRARRVPDLVLSSPATRAVSTVEMAAEAGGWRAPVRLVDVFYGGGPGAAIEAIRRVEGADRVAVFGHEPTWSSLVSILIGGGAVRMPTAAAAALEVPAWAAIGPGTCRLVWMLVPRLFTDGDFDLSDPAPR
jgi:phosphohistidine phosphatase